MLHRCDNPPCTNPLHLFLGSRADNNEDMRTKGRASGTGLFSPERFARLGHPRAKLTQEDVDEIRASYVPYQVTCQDLALRFGVSVSAIKKVLSCRNWPL